MRNYGITSLCGWLLISCSWFCLWVLSYYFIMEPELAILLFPFALRLGTVLHTPKRYWLAVYGAEWWLMVSLAILLDQPQWLSVIAASLISVPIIWFAQKYYYGSQWRRLCVMGVVIFSTALLNVLVFSSQIPSLQMPSLQILSLQMQGVQDAALITAPLYSLWMVFLVSVTGGLMLVPSCYLIWSYLFQKSWIPLTVNLVSKPIELRSRHVVIYVVLFALSIAAQVGLPEELRRFAPFCLAIPIILLAFRYGWQGALLGTLLNSVALIAARSGVSNMEITDLLLSLSAQSLTGILLGMGIQRQRELNQKLRHELNRNHNLSRQLVKAEESVRRDIARELHDEIGQNITAIRTQASILKRVENTPMGESCASTIESLSLNIYDTTKGLLTQLRPKTLDDLGLEEAIHQLVRELECEANGISTTIIWNEPTDVDLDLSDATSVTLYRICQEALNNMVKYAQATEAKITITFENDIYLTVKDNGVGFKPEEALRGFGLRGMKERVQALGGEFTLSSDSGTQKPGTALHVVLPKL
ncbi:signal transduction histidine-protein kinase/phosphatase UhpB [Photobacterium profundum]|uniref:UhpB, Signal transduction histidine kinase, glucose-6-phosphate specific n=1 Tax=Photobacterium profundum (strain SS9) TaxID=298386 RepID=Q6LPP5_PHOPR|nr:signal transduction histidine-protein kinase/phosphatase UhpB [Photobacterium profundum]CAG20731.1 putative UhpB, Signal transduction histidine kinase, glucose-6-phosphate specific [Photobacterium profundum SS9]